MRALRLAAARAIAAAVARLDREGLAAFARALSAERRRELADALDAEDNVARAVEAFWRRRLDDVRRVS